MSITYLKGDALQSQIEGPKIIAHICNDRGGFGKGFALAVAKRWKSAEQYYKRWYASKVNFRLGVTQVVEVEPDLWVANMVAQHGYKTISNIKPIDYAALRVCLEELSTEAKARSAVVVMPRIGTKLAGGDWAVIEPLIKETLGTLAVYIYDLS